ncbi:hypothetical protein OIC43_37215 [Streptomyces sp. NBC_00825]|uniref:hypothetical protein n=1 Tax=unclassified Streptomyces TaxID=2593676 RepID=UPI002ED2C746|nr:hypothetical protein OG832_06475 [Streptomyces sp. NBC_00826]WTH94278.1 hypothetical protein OIC43_37215 [Streptomyces sp. NBC_00825]WTI03013.1 hypothetical protein OHA23_37195 [Streptomyces sp. NBC_00822]
MTTRPPITLAPDLDPWERQPNETPHKHGQLATYRDLGRTRTLTEAAQRLTLAYGHVRNLAAQYRWRERVEAYDRHLDRQYEAMWLEERRKAAETDAKILGAAIGKLAQRLTTLNAAELSPGDFIRLMDVSMRHRRVLFGDPTETIAVTGEGTNALAQHFADFAEMSPEQRRARLGELAASVNQRIKAVDGSGDEDETEEG